MTGRIESYEFKEGVDFTVDKFVIGRTTQIDYSLTLSMAKELCMVENNEQGKVARKYFVERERLLGQLQRVSERKLLMSVES
jgi:anti-repressor protein